MKRTLLAALVVTASLVVPAGYLAGPAAAAACSGTSGVTVVVQFPDRTEVACAPGDPASGFAALTGAGFDPTRVAKFPGAVCRIDGYPDAEADPCVTMPPANAYWTYFHAQPGGEWVPSNVGADSYNPKPGSVEGWRFGDGAKPSTAPPGTPPTPKSSATPKPSASAGQSTTSKPGSTSTAGSSVAAPGSTSGSTPGSTPTGTATAAPSASGSPTGTTTAGVPSTATTGSAAAAGQEPQAVTEPASSGGASWIWGIALLAVVAAIGGTVAYRRRV